MGTAIGHRMLTDASPTGHPVLMSTPRPGSDYGSIMETLVATMLGAIAGLGATKVHRFVDGGWWLAVPAGALGGYLGKGLWADALAPSLAESTLAGAAVGGAIGGIGLAVIAALLRRAIGR